MRILVTGGAGFIGSNFIRYWLRKYPSHKIVNLDKLTYAGNLSSLRDVRDNPNYKFVKGDICDGKLVDKLMTGRDLVVHFAAESIPEYIFLPIYSSTGTRVLTFKDLWEQQRKKNPVQKTQNGEIIFLRGKQTKALSFLNGGQWMPIKAITRHWYKGKIIKLNQKWGIVEATPNHSVYAANLELTDAQTNPELLVIRNVNENNKKFKNVNKKLLAIIAAYITEGNATFNKANGGYIVEIGQKDKNWLEEVGCLIKEHFGYNFSISQGRKNEFTFYHLQVSNKKFFNYLVNRCGKYCDGKFFPNWIFDLDREGREYFWQKLLEGDGTEDGRYTTTSCKLANQLGLLLSLLGKSFTVFERNNTKYKKSWEFKTVSSGRHYGLVQRKKTQIDYEGWVYDIEVEKVHNFVCGLGNIVCHNTHVDRSILGPQMFVKTNVIGTQVLLDSAVKNEVKRFHQISTDECFGALPDSGDDKFDENWPFRPNSPYAASKAAADCLVRSYWKTYGLQISITNCSNNFGPYQFPEKLIPLFVTNLMEGKKVPVYGDGLQVRDWLYVEDHCRAIDLIVHNEKVVGETFCVGGLTKDIPNIQVVKKILKIMGKDESKIEYVKDRPGHDRRYSVDWSKIKTRLGWQPKHDFDTWLEKTIKWYKNNTNWWKPLKEKQQLYFRRQYGR